MTTIEDHKEMIRRITAEIWNQGKLGVVDELFSPNYVGHVPAMPLIQGPEGFKQLVSNYRTAFPDVHLTLEDMFAEGDRIVFRWTSRGTNTGSFAGGPATGRKIEIMGITIFRITNGLVEEEWEGFDSMMLMQQLGLMPAPGGAQ